MIGFDGIAENAASAPLLFKVKAELPDVFQVLILIQHVAGRPQLAELPLQIPVHGHSSSLNLW